MEFFKSGPVYALRRKKGTLSSGRDYSQIYEDGKAVAETIGGGFLLVLLSLVGYFAYRKYRQGGDDEVILDTSSDIVQEFVSNFI